MKRLCVVKSWIFTTQSEDEKLAESYPRVTELLDRGIITRHIDSFKDNS